MWIFRYIPSGLVRAFVAVCVILVLYTRFFKTENDTIVAENNKNRGSMQTSYKDSIPKAMLDSHEVQSRESREDIYSYVEPEIAGSGTYEDEMSRFNRYISTQQAVCVDLKKMGGAVPRPIFQYDPDGVWPVCLDKKTGINPFNCTVYSFGINNEWSFDEAMEKFGCNVYAFDPTMDVGDHQHSPKIKFYKTGLGDNNTDPVLGEDGSSRGLKLRTLNTIIELLNHQKIIIDVLKMDIELWEWKSLVQIMKTDTLRRQVRQLSVEFHVPFSGPSKVRRSYAILKWLERQGFLIINKHRNAVCQTCYEISFVNINLVKLQTNPHFL